MMNRTVALTASLLAWNALAAAAVAQTAAVADGSGVAWSWWLTAVSVVALVGWMRVRRRRLCEELLALRSRHAGLIASALRMREASGLIPLLAGHGPQVRALNRRFREAVEEANRLSAELDRAEDALGRWRLGRAQGCLEGLAARVAAFEREVAEVEAAMRGLHADVHECLRHMSAVTALHDELTALLGKRDWGWDQDVKEALSRLGEQIKEAERLRNAGDLVEALRLAKEAQSALAVQKQVLEARQASLTWLENAAAEARRLEGEERRLAQAGFRALPVVDVARIRREAQGAIAALQRGAVAEAAAKQQALRHEVKALRAALVGREELYWANRRHLAALRTELAAIEAQLQSVNEADGRARYPRRLWKGASELHGALQTDLAALASHLDAAQTANDMQVQEFERAHDQLRRARALTQALRQDLARCQAMWQALPQWERRLKDRTLALLGEAAEAKARARQLGAAIDPRLVAMLDEVRQVMASRPLDLEEGARALEAAETALRRFKERMASLETRLERQQDAHGRPAAVTLTRVEIPFETEHAEGRRG